MVQSTQFPKLHFKPFTGYLEPHIQKVSLKNSCYGSLLYVFSYGKLSRKLENSMYNLFILIFSADHLSMETLLSMTSKRAGEWFKEELRELGGLDHLVRTSSDCLNFLVADEISMWTEPLHNKLRKTGRVLKVLESVSFLIYFC